MGQARQDFDPPTIDSALKAENAELRQRLSDLARLVSDWVWETAPDGCLINISQRVVEHLGLHPVGLKGKRFDQFGVFPERPFPDSRRAFRDLPFEAVETGGRTRLYRLSGLPMFDATSGDFIGFRGTAKDVTEETMALRQAEDALRAAGRANQAKSDFLAHMSHELRTPLNAIIGFSDAMMSHIFGPIGSPRYREYIGHIRQSGHHLLDLVNDVLDLSKVEAGAMSFHTERINCRTILKEVIGLTSLGAEQAGVVLKTVPGPDPVCVVADQLRLRQVVLNLVSNAIKFTSPGREISLSATPRDLDKIEIVIQDQGVGMTDVQVREAMNRFGQVESAIARPGQGTGLGLPLSKALVEGMGGTFGLESEPNVGTRVWLLLPKAPVRPSI